MKMSIVVVVVVLALEILLALSPQIPQLATVWRTDNAAAFYSTLATAVGLQFCLLSAAFSVIFLRESSNFRDTVHHLLARTSGALIRQLRDDEFYYHFFAAARSAQSIVRISYFAPYPPMKVSDRDRNRYYQEIADLMRRQSRVRFKRIVRDSRENAEWIAELVRELEGKSNVDLAVLRGDLAAESEMPLALSAQIIDDHKVWLVAVASHERQGEYRDLYIENGDVADAMVAYYTRLWIASDELLKAGVLTPAGSAYTRRFRERND